MIPQGDVARRERPLLPREARPPPPAPGLPPPLPGSSSDPEVQKPPEGGAPYGDTRQSPAHKQDLVCDRIICGGYKDSSKCRTGKRAKERGSYEHHTNINFCLGGITNEIHTPEAQSLNLASQPRCSLFSYTNAVRSRRT